MLTSTMKKLLAVLTLSVVTHVGAFADDLPTFRLDCKNGVFTPAELQVPAGKKFKIEIYNTGTEAIEFESKQLKKEKAIAPGANSFVVIYPLEPGEYKFFDEFHMKTGQGRIIAK